MNNADELLGSWIERELIEVPQELAVRIRTALPSGWRDTELMNAPALLTAAAVSELGGLFERSGGCESRRAAPGLLTVDALVTYACELLTFSDADISAGATAILDVIARALPQAESPA